METKSMDITEGESHTWARTRMGLMSQKLSWIFKITFFYFLAFIIISSSLPTTTATDTHHSFSDSFGYLDLELNNELVELDAYNFKSVILEYPTVFVYFNFENNRRNAAILQTLELVAQLLSNKNVLVAKVTDKQFAEMLDIPASGSFRAYHKGHVFPFYGYPAADVIMHFILKVREPVVKEISGKETKIAFDKVNVPTIVGFFEEENEDYSVFEEAALSYLPYIQFYATFDETVAKHLKLDEPGMYRYRRPLEEKSFLVEERLSTVEDVERVVEMFKAGPLHKFSLHNIYHPWNREEKDEEFLAFADPKSPKGKTFHKVLEKFIKKEMQKSNFDVKIIWIDPSEYPMMIPIWEHKYEISLDEPHFGHITDSEVRWLEIQRLMEFEEKHKKHSVMKKWISNEEDPYTPEEPEPEQADGEDTEESNDDVNKEQGETEKDAEGQKCGEENECSKKDTEGTTQEESEENEDESVETEEEEEEEETETDEPQETEEEYSIDEWMDYFDQLEEMEMLKDQEEKKVKEDRKASSKEKPALKKTTVVEKKPVVKENPVPSVPKQQQQQERQQQDEKDEKDIPKEPEKKISTKAELEETLNEINKLVDQLTNGHNEDNAKPKEQPVDEIDDQLTLEEGGEENITETKEEAEEESEEEEETIKEEIDTEENLRTSEEVLIENEALRKENMALKEELKEEEDEEEEDDDDDDEDDDHDIPSQKSSHKTGKIMYKDQENYPTYNVDLDVLVDSFDGGSQDEWDQYFDELEHKKSTEEKPGDKILKESEKKKKMKKKEKAKESDHYMFKEEDYPLYNVDLDVLVDSFEADGGDEWTRYFDRLEAEEDRKLDERMKRKAQRTGSGTGRGSGGGGSSFFAAGMPMKDEKIRVKQFLEREKQRRGHMKRKIDKESIKTYLRGKSNDKDKDNQKETIDTENDDNDNGGKGHNENSEEPMKKEERADDNKEQIVMEDETPPKNRGNTILKNPKNQEDSNILQATLLKLVKDIEELLSFNGHANGIVHTGAPHEAETKEEPNIDESKEKKSQNFDNHDEKFSSILNVESLNLLPKDIDLTDPENVVNTIKHTTNAVNKIMQDFADSLTARLLDGKTGRDGDDGDDDDDDEPWEVREEWEEKLRKLCKKGRLSSADCNQIIHGRSMEHVYNFQKSKSPKVPKFKPSPPFPPEEPEPEPEPADSAQEVSEPEPEPADSSQEVPEPKITQEETFENTDVGDEKEQVQETAEISNEEVKKAQEPMIIANSAQEEGDKIIDETILDIEAEPIQDEIIASETGTNFDESLFYDEETIHRKEEEQFFYRFDDWNQPASSSPIVDNALDYRSQKYFDELEGIDKLETDGNIVDDSQNTFKDDEKENVDKHQPKEDSKSSENGHKIKKESKDDKKKDKKEKGCDCEKERKKLKGKKDKHYGEEEWEERGKYVEKYKSSDSSEPCDCKWKLLP